MSAAMVAKFENADDFNAAIVAAVRAGLTFQARAYPDDSAGPRFIIVYTGGF